MQPCLNDIVIERGDRIDKNRTEEGVKIRPLENIVENRKGKKVFSKKWKNNCNLASINHLEQ